MKVVVTGGSGLIGTATIRVLAAQGHEVVNLDLQPSSTAARHYTMDVTDAPAVQEVFARERPDAVLHLAAQVSVPLSVRDPIGDMHHNILGSLSVFEAARHSGVKRVVAASSAAVYGDQAVPPIAERVPLAPTSPYGVAKVAMEQYLCGFYKDFFHYGILRYGNVYGPRQRHESGAVIAKLVHDAVTDGQVHVDGDGSQQRDFVHVDDIAMVNLSALQSDESWVLNVGSGVPVTVMEVVNLIGTVLDHDVAVAYGPTRAGDIHASYYDVAKITQVLGWKPAISLETGVMQIVAARDESRR